MLTTGADACDEEAILGDNDVNVVLMIATGGSTEPSMPDAPEIGRLSGAFNNARNDMSSTSCISL